MPLNTKRSAGSRRFLRERDMTIGGAAAVVAALLLAFALLFVALNRFIRSMNQSLSAQAETVASQTSDLLNGYVRLCDTLTVNENLLEFATADGTESEEALTVAGYPLRKDLNAQVAIYGEDINTLAVYFVRSGSVITMSRQVSAANSHLFFDSYPSLSPDLLQQMPTGENWYLHFADDSDPHHYIVRRIANRGETLAYAIVEFDLPGFAARIMPEDGVLVLGSPEQVFFAAGTEKAGSEIFSQAAREARFALDDHRYTGCLKTTRLSGLQVLVGVSTDQLVHIRWLLLAVIAAVSVLTLASMAVLIYWLNRQLFRPVEKLIETANAQPADAPVALHSIAQDLIETKTANDAMRQERSRMFPLALGRQLGHLLETTDRETALLYARSALLLVDIEDGDGYALFGVCCAEDRAGFFADMRRDPRQTQKAELFRYLLDNVLNDLLFQDYPGIVAPLRENWFLVVVSCGSAADAEQVDDILRQLLDTYEKTFNVTLIATHTLWGNTAEEFYKSLQEASQEIAYLDFWGGAREQNGAEVQPESFSQYHQLVRKLFARLNLRDYDSIPLLLDDLFDQTLLGGVENIQITKHRIYALAALILSGIDEQLGDDKNFAATHNFEQRLYRADNIADFKKELRAILDELTAYKKQQDITVTSPSRMEEVKQYILDHYTENELTAASIAAAFQMSSSYLSRAFKEYTGRNILDYIQRLRVDAAKELLRTESVKSAAQRVGFWDTQGLVRAFKKHEGMTPSEYKRIQESQGRG